MAKDLTQQTFTLKDGRTLGFAEYGDLKGKPVFFFHGWPCSRLHAVITDRTAKKYHLRIISFDRPGYGLSTYSDKWTMKDCPKDTIQLADALKIKKFSIMGVSGGGPYAAIVADTIPKRIHKAAIVVGLSPIRAELMEGASGIAKFCWLHYRDHPYLRKSASIFQYLLAHYSPGFGIYRLLWGAQADKKMYNKKEIKGFAQNNYKEAFRQGYKGAELDLTLLTQNWKFKISDITIPISLWYGSDDQNVSVKMGEFYHKHLKKSSLTIFPNEGHFISHTHVDEIMSALK